MISRFLTTQWSIAVSKSLVNVPFSSNFSGTKDEFEDLAEVARQVFEYEYPAKKKEEPLPVPED
jgi:hypothetical protein